MEVTVNLNLVSAMIQIIDRSAQAGAFTGVDLTTVGQIRAQLVQVVETNQQAQPDGPLANKVAQ
jgi:hypothetical protein